MCSNYFLQYYQAEKELEDAKRKLKDMTIVLEQRNDDITKLRKQNRDNSTKDSEKVKIRNIFREMKKVGFFHNIFSAHFVDVVV